MIKIGFPEKEIEKIINLYVNEKLNLSAIGDKYNVSKTTIKRILIENQIKIFSPGQRYKGGPKLAKKRFYEKKNKVVAHQYKIRKEKEKLEKNSLPFDVTKVSLKNTKIEIIERIICKKIVDEYEWLGYLPRYTNLHFGIYFEIDGNYYLGGVVAYQPEYGENLGIWDKYGYTNKIIQLSRGVCLWWTPKNSASYFIQRTLQYLKKNTKYKVVTATVDSSAGEIGIIYQSLNWYYVGILDGNISNNGKELTRYGYKIGDKTYNERHIRERIGSAKKENVLKHFPDVQIVNLGRKKRYFQFIGRKNENKELLKSIEHLIKPYPKK